MKKNDVVPADILILDHSEGFLNVSENSVNASS